MDPVTAIFRAKAELTTQQERGEWSGLIDTSGSPIYTLKEIAQAVVREINDSQQKLTL